MNAIHASDDVNDVLKYNYASDIVISPGGEGTVSFTMTDTYIGSDKYSTVQVYMGENYDQSTEAPMPNAISVTLEQLTYNPTKNDDSGVDDKEDDGDSSNSFYDDEIKPATDNRGLIIAALVMASILLVATVVVIILKFKMEKNFEE